MAPFPGRFAAVSVGRPSSAGSLCCGDLARAISAEREHELVAATDRHENESPRFLPQDQYEGNLRLFLGDDLADQGDGHLADT
jgi:hypothetical protein